MRFDFKKITSVLASVVMLSSTAGIALAANYPSPFVVGGAANGAIVVTSGSHAGSQVDLWAAVDLQSALQGLVTAAKTTTAGTVTGEAYPLFTGSTKIYYNDTVKKVKEILTDSEMPTILADTDFSGKVDADVVQTIKMVGGADYSYVTFDKMPTTDEDPVVGLKLSTTRGKDLYNITITLDKAENFTHTDSEGETLTLFGQEFTVGVDTDDDELFLYKSSQVFSLSVGGDAPNPSTTATIEGKEYTVQLTAATDTSATVKVTDSTGKSDTKEISEAQSKKILDVEIAVNLADESTATDSISAEIIVGAQKVRLKDGDEVKLGTDQTPIDGTWTEFTGGGSPHNITQIIIQVGAPDSSTDAVIPGGAFIDPVFGTFKVDFVGLNIEETSTARETFEIQSTQDTATLKMTTHTGDEKTITWYNNESAAAVLADADRDYIRVREMATVNQSEYIVVGNEDEGYLMEVVDITNGTTGYSDDEVQLKDVFSGNTYDASITAEGSGTITIGGKQYTLYYVADKDAKEERAFYINLNYPDSSGKDIVLFPTIQTKKGARITFYEPQVINLSNWDGSGYGALGGVTGSTNSVGKSRNITGLVFPDGDKYETTFTIGRLNSSVWNVTVSSVVYNIDIVGGSLPNSLNKSLKLADGNTAAFKLNMTGSTVGLVNITLMDNAGVPIQRPSIMIFEEEDDNNDRLGLIVQMEGGGTSTDEVGVQDVEMAWETREYTTSADRKQLKSDDDLYKLVDLYGVFITIDTAEASQYTATINYPDEQVYAQIYVSEIAASVTAETTTGGGGTILVVKDTEVDSVKNSNLAVVGGSCINSVAAKVLGISYPTCGDDWTSATNVGPGQYLIKAVKSPYNADKTAVLVAGYAAADTKNAAGKLRESHATDVGTSSIYPQVSA